ncbi:MAG TPA: alanine racemase, partial [Chitinophagaceae bacterium]|nr:alanine racemase [Chitinophagaceae bacterium]
FTEVDFVIDDKETSLSVPFTDEASIQNCLTCYAVLSYLKIPHEKIQKRILQLKHVSMRLELKKGINHCSIINDSYSADISSLKIALDFLAEQRQHPSRSVIISDFVQSGMKEDTLYSHIAGALEQHGVDRIIGIGEKISAHREKFKKISRQNFYSSTNEFLSDFRDAAFSNEAILIKGARVFAFEKIDRLLGEKLHHTVLEIDLNALKHNLKQYQNHLHKGTKVMAMVKAFAYGSGSYEIASVLQFNKVDYLAVAYADEAVELRKAGINMPIMVMNTESDSFENLIEYDLQPVIYSTALLNDLKSFLIDEDIRHFPVHIEINTGMNRLGFDPVQIDPSIETFSSATFRIQSVFSHLAASEDPQQNEFTISQSVIFNQVCDQLQRRISYPFLRHIANSAAILRFPELQMNMVRLGIGLYGIDSGNTKELELQEVSTLRSTIAQIRHIKKGETVSYGRKGIADDDKIIATVRIGYADGYPRSLGNGVGKMFVSGQLAPIIGTICMDMTMIDVTNIASVQEEDEVIVFGKELSAEQVARWAGTIPYEILTGVSQRVKRIYYQD